MIGSSRIVVLDDDPTGTQTVLGVPVFTQWSVADMREALEGQELFFILTNSRACTVVQTRRLHREVLTNLLNASIELGRDFEIVSRSDSTLRGHYPVEMDTIRTVLMEHGRPVDGEIIAPFFLEGGRITSGDMHYLVRDGMRVPVGDTEFARDRTFGFRSSNLREWVEEKTGGAVKAGSVVSISLSMLREQGDEAVGVLLTNASPSTRFIVNAETYEDMEVFVRSLTRARAVGKRFIYRTAASFVRVFGGIKPRSLLSGEEVLRGVDEPNGGLIVVGSHVKKTTEQLAVLLESKLAEGVEFNVHAVVAGAAQREIERCCREIETLLACGRSAVVFTSRETAFSEEQIPEMDLNLSTRISRSLVEVVARLKCRPRFVVAKGGITSSDVATMGLGIHKAEVLGQLLPGVPVWRQGSEARFPGQCLVVFPGNVGESDALRAVVEKLAGRGPEFNSGIRAAFRETGNVARSVDIS